MTENALQGQRVLVVGASSGIGRGVARMVVAEGGSLAVSARRAAMLDEAVAEAGGGVAIPGDVRDPESCAAVVAETVRRLGGLDALVYATAVDPLVRIADADAARWHDTFATNVVGAALYCRAALPHLQKVAGRAIFISATSVGRPLPAMGVYASSKAALEEMVRAWRSEHTDVGFCSVRIGMTLGTGVIDSWDPELLGEMSPRWGNGGYTDDNGPGMMNVDQAAAAVMAALTAPVCLRDLSATASPVVG